MNRRSHFKVDRRNQFKLSQLFFSELYIVSAFAIDSYNERFRGSKNHNAAGFDRRLDTGAWITPDALALRTNRKQTKRSNLNRFATYEGGRDLF